MKIFDFVPWFLAVPLLCCFVVALASLHFMTLLINKKLPSDERLSYVHPFGIYSIGAQLERMADTYNRFYPQGRGYRAWQVSALTTAAFAAAIVVDELLRMAMAQ
jgi:hypothetical protein